MPPPIAAAFKLFDMYYKGSFNILQKASYARDSNELMHVFSKYMSFNLSTRDLTYLKDYFDVIQLFQNVSGTCKELKAIVDKDVQEATRLKNDMEEKVKLLKNDLTSLNQKGIALHNIFTRLKLSIIKANSTMQNLQLDPVMREFRQAHNSAAAERQNLVTSDNSLGAELRGSINKKGIYDTLKHLHDDIVGNNNDIKRVNDEIKQLQLIIQPLTFISNLPEFHKTQQVRVLNLLFETQKALCDITMLIKQTLYKDENDFKIPFDWNPILVIQSVSDMKGSFLLLGNGRVARTQERKYQNYDLTLNTYKNPKLRGFGFDNTLDTLGNVPIAEIDLEKGYRVYSLVNTFFQTADANGIPYKGLPYLTWVKDRTKRLPLLLTDKFIKERQAAFTLLHETIAKRILNINMQGHIGGMYVPRIVHNKAVRKVYSTKKGQPYIRKDGKRLFLADIRRRYRYVN